MNFPFEEAYSIDKDISAVKIRGLVRGSYDVNKALLVVIKALGEAIAADNDSETPIFEKPYFRRSMFAISVLLSAGPTSDSRYTHTTTPLCVATEIGYAPTIPVLIAAGFDEVGWALQRACHIGNIEILDTLISAFPTNLPAVVAGDNTLLHMLAHSATHHPPENVQIVKRLIEAGADVNQKDYRNRTALFGRACENPEMIATLVAAGADVNQYCGTSREGIELFPLHCAAAGKDAVERRCAHAAKHNASVNLLLRLGAKIDALNSSGYSALSSAALFNNHSTLKTLLAAGARIRADDYTCAVATRAHTIKNCLVFLLAVEYDHDACNALFRKTATADYPEFDDLKTLVAAGADFAALVAAENEIRKKWLPYDNFEILDFLAELDDAADDLSQLDWFDEKRAELDEARSEISTMIFQRYRDDMATICIGLQSLALPALVTLAVIDAWMGWHPHYHLVPMHQKWDFITTIKHFEMLEHGKNKRKRN